MPQASSNKKKRAYLHVNQQIIPKVFAVDKIHKQTTDKGINAKSAPQ